MVAVVRRVLNSSLEKSRYHRTVGCTRKGRIPVLSPPAQTYPSFIISLFRRIFSRAVLYMYTCIEFTLGSLVVIANPEVLPCALYTQMHSKPVPSPRISFSPLLYTHPWQTGKRISKSIKVADSIIRRARWQWWHRPPFQWRSRSMFQFLS